MLLMSRVAYLSPQATPQLGHNHRVGKSHGYQRKAQQPRVQEQHIGPFVRLVRPHLAALHRLGAIGSDGNDIAQTVCRRCRRTQPMHRLQPLDVAQGRVDQEAYQPHQGDHFVRVELGLPAAGRKRPADGKVALQRDGHQGPDGHRNGNGCNRRGEHPDGQDSIILCSRVLLSNPRRYNWLACSSKPLTEAILLANYHNEEKADAGKIKCPNQERFLVSFSVSTNFQWKN